jgi:hypothetical protein
MIDSLILYCLLIKFKFTPLILPHNQSMLDGLKSLEEYL